MNITDPIGDMLTRIRNASQMGHNQVVMPGSKIKVAIAKILKEEGYVSSYEVVDGKVANSKVLRIRLKYVGERRQRRSVITGLDRVSRPGRRVYSGKQDIPWVLAGRTACVWLPSVGLLRQGSSLQTDHICAPW